MKKSITIVVINNPALAKLLGVKQGDKVSVECKNKIPLLREWRNRFRDAEIDNCISVCQTTKKTKKTTEGEK